MPVQRVVRVDEPARRVVPAGDSDDHLVLDDERCAGRRITDPVVGEHDVPGHAARSRIERKQVGVGGGHEQPIAQQAEAAVHGRNGAVGEVVGQLAAVLPERPAGARVEGPRAVEGTGHVHHAVGHERRPLESPARDDAGLKGPLGGETMNVAGCDLLERTVTLSAVVARVSHPARRIPVASQQILKGDSGRRALLRNEKARAENRNHQGHGRGQPTALPTAGVVTDWISRHVLMDVLMDGRGTARRARPGTTAHRPGRGHSGGRAQTPASASRGRERRPAARTFKYPCSRPLVSMIWIENASSLFPRTADSPSVARDERHGLIRRRHGGAFGSRIAPASPSRDWPWAIRDRSGPSGPPRPFTT